MKQVDFLSRKNFFFIKFFDPEAEQEFLEEVRETNAPGGFVEIVVIIKQGRIYEVQEIDVFKETWKRFAYKYMRASSSWFFSWKEYDCIYATKPQSESSVTA